MEASARASQPIRVVIVEDHDVYRMGISRLLAEHGFDVVGQARDGAEAIRLVGRLVPDVVLMDLKLPRMDGIEVTRRLAVETPHARVLVLTISADDDDITEAILAGAGGYLIKDATITEIAAGIRAAAAGESLISPCVAAKLLADLRARGREPARGERMELSGREIEVLRLVTLGKDNAEIGRQLFISPQTVKNHISNILAKLQMENRIQAAVYAVREGIV